jgi:aspartyl-tRNA(Asn)/glutamyl-tRNA(Gln) amidotransferase subunit C
MSVDRDHAAAIASLARLRFGGEELERITQEMNQVLAYVEELKGLEVDDVPRDRDPLEGEGDVTRGPGAETPDLLGHTLAAMAPEEQAGFFLVPPLPGVRAEEGE